MTAPAEGEQPLSDDEKRILEEIEDQLYETDPGLAKAVSKTTVYTAAFKKVKWAILGFIIGVLIMIFTLSTSFWVAASGFVVMLGSCLLLERNLRQLGKTGMEQMMQSASGKKPLGDYVDSFQEKMKDRFKRK